jgi:NAD(P)-dependent dehydrogenase (short-subunit alcohol dehydrogenase family)
MALDLALNGKTALITGASQGIGLAIARALLAEGVSVVITSRTTERLQQAAAALRDQPASASAADRPRLHAIVADLGLRSEVERLAHQTEQQLGHVDILVNSASAAGSGPFFQMTDEALVEIWQVKALGYMRLVRALAPGMMQRRSGNIVNIVGGTARTPTLDFIPGSMVNAALVNFTRGISRELASYGVRINSVSPGWTMTERQERSFEMEAAARKVPVQEIERLRSRSVPLRRLVAGDEIAALTLLLVSDRLPSMTGEDIVIDGGATPST